MGDFDLMQRLELVYIEGIGVQCVSSVGKVYMEVCLCLDGKSRVRISVVGLTGAGYTFNLTGMP